MGPMTQGDPLPERHVDLRLSARGAGITVSLVAHHPGRACFAHQGGFAFFERTAQAAAPSGHAPQEEALLQAFRQLFLKVVAESRPATLDALADALLARGARLYLTRRSRGEGHGLRVRLSRVPP
jgi:hypothetical protein